MPSKNIATIIAAATREPLSGPNGETGFRTCIPTGIDMPNGAARRAALGRVTKAVTDHFKGKPNVAVTFGIEPNTLMIFEW